MKFKTLLSVRALSLAAFAGSAQAALISSLDFATKSGWLADGAHSSTIVPTTGVTSVCAAGATNAANGCGLTFSGASGIANAYTTVNWGTVGQKSGLDIVSRAGTLVTNGDWVQTGLITHRNQPIPNTAKSLTSLELATIFSIVNPPLFEVDAKVGIKFTETLNEKDPAKCPTPQLSAVGCDDTFLINLNLPAIKFKVGNETYTIKFKLNPLSGVTQSVVNPDGSIVLITREADINQLELLARLEVPSPATVGMLGLSLVLLSMRRRMK